MARPITQAAPSPSALVNTQRSIESFDLSADGSLVIYGLRSVVGGRYRSHLWSVPWTGGRARRLTDGAVRDSSPALSPDGRSVAFIRTPAVDDPPDGQVFVLGVDGGNPRPLAKLPHGAASPAWAPDGGCLAVLGPAGPRRFDIGPEGKGRQPTARHITRTDFRDDESGFPSRRVHLWALGTRRGSRPRCLTDGDFDVSHHAWSADGRWLYFSADPGLDANIAPRQRIFMIRAHGGPMEQLATLRGDADRPAPSPDGMRLALIGTDVDDPPDHVLDGLWVQDLAGGEAANLTADLDRSVGLDAWADLVYAEDGPGPIWLDDETLLTMVSDRGRNLPYRVSAGGGTTPLLQPGRVVGAGLRLGRHDGEDRIALSAAVDGRSAEVWAVEGGVLRRLTRHGSDWQDRFPLPELEELDVDGPAGSIQVWVASPAGMALGGGGRPLPTITVIHGGPSGAHGPGGTLDAMLLTSHGYRVVMPNIRGSATFGSEWIAALGGRWGEVDAADLLAVVDAAVAKGLADPDRLGVMGLSYGGYLTQWLVGVTDRFGAAVSENGVTNQVSDWANSYFGVHYDRRAGLGDPLSEDGMLRLWNGSPLRNAAAIRTPLLMLQAEEDRICPAADNEQLFTALKVLGREVEYVLYPEEHHEMKMYGRPDRRTDRMERILGWFDRWLGGD